MVCLHGASLDKVAAKGAQQRSSKIEKLASSKSILLPIVPQPAKLQPLPPPVPVPIVVQPATTPQLTLAGLLNQPGISPPQPPLPTLTPAPVVRKFNPANEKKANSKLYQAQKLEKEGKVRLASKLFTEIVAKFPDTEAAQTAESKADKVVDHRTDKAQE